MDIEAILGCIGDDIEIGARPVEAGLSNLGRVKGTVTEDSIEEIGFNRKTVFGKKRNSYHTDLMKGIIVNIRSGAGSSSGKAVKKSQNVLIAMLEELVSKKDATEKKRILADEYGMIMTVELERRIQIMCNWSESIRERERRDARNEARIEARIEALERMLRVNITREQILSMGYTEAEYEKAESALYANA